MYVAGKTESREGRKSKKTLAKEPMTANISSRLPGK
jgi:hypothetical protein